MGSIALKVNVLKRILTILFLSLSSSSPDECVYRERKSNNLISDKKIRIKDKSKHVRTFFNLPAMVHGLACLGRPEQALLGELRCQFHQHSMSIFWATRISMILLAHHVEHRV